MKKTLLSITLACFSLGAMAQVDETFVFCDAEGSAIVDGTVINVTDVVEDIMTGEQQMHSGLYVKYNGNGNGAFAGMSLDIQHMDNGVLKHCFPGQCLSYSEVGKIVRSDAKGLKAGEIEDVNSEWMPTDKGLCTVAYTLHLSDRNGNFSAQGPTVVVNYCNGVEAPNNNIAGVKGSYTGKMYNLQGQEVNKNYTGVVILNGKKLIKK